MIETWEYWLWDSQRTMAEALMGDLVQWHDVSGGLVPWNQWAWERLTGLGDPFWRFGRPQF